MAKGHYDLVVDEIFKINKNNLGKKIECTLDIGCGSAYYIQKIIQDFSIKFAYVTYVSKHAIKYASKENKSKTGYRWEHLVIHRLNQERKCYQIAINFKH